MKIRLTAALALAALAAPSQAAGAGWQAPSSHVLPAGAYAGQGEVLFQEGGIATDAFDEVRTEGTATIDALHLGAAAPGAPYADRLIIPPTAQYAPAQPQISVAPDGAAVAAWLESAPGGGETSPFRFLASYRPAGSPAWQAPQVLQTDTQRPAGVGARLTTAISPDGVAAVAFQHFAAGESTGKHGRPNYRIDVSLHSPSGAWQAPVRLSPGSTSAIEPSLAFDAAGDLTAVYLQRDFEGDSGATDRYFVIARRLPAGGGWGAEEAISPAGEAGSASAAAVAVAPSGSAVLDYAYTTEPPVRTDVWAAAREGAGGAWTAAARVDAGAGSRPLGLAESSAGAYLLYSFQGEHPGETCVRTARVLDTTGALRSSGQGCASQNGAVPSAGSVAVAGGRVYLAWVLDESGGERQEQGASLAEGAEGAPADTSSIGQAAPGIGDPELVPDGVGAVVDLYTGERGELLGSQFLPAVPVLRAGLSAAVCAGRARECARLQHEPGTWRTLRGTLQDLDVTGGPATVEVGVYRGGGQRVQALRGGVFRTVTLRSARRRLVSAALSGAGWTLRLPRLAAGAYTILVRASDAAGETSATVSRTVTIR